VDGRVLREDIVIVMTWISSILRIPTMENVMECVEISSSRSYGPDWKKYAEKDIFLKMIDIGWISNEFDFMNDTEGIIALISAI
jgi:hypothetical protein